MSIKCRVCASQTGASIFTATILRSPVQYFDCRVCGYVQTQDPTWLDEAYQSAINKSDTGILARNHNNVCMVLATLASVGNRNGQVIDCAGGYGILVRLLRDQGIEALWSDPYCNNLLAIGFEHVNESADLVTAFEAFEHFVDPVGEMEKLFSHAPNLLISTELISSPAPTPQQWWYYGLDHGQHIGFFRTKTLQRLAQHFGKHLVTDGISYHLYTQQPVSAAVWHLSRRLASRFPAVFTRGMQSKVWSDFKKMSVAK